MARILHYRQTGRLLAVWLAFVLAPYGFAAQAAGKRALNHGDYDTWRSIQLEQLSNDGKFLAYALTPQDADGEVVARNLATGAEWRHPRGSRPETPGRPEPDDRWNGTSEVEDQRGPRRGPRGGGAASAGLAFTADGKFLVFQIFPTKAETETATKEKKRPEEMPKNSMGIMDLATGEVRRIEGVKSFQVPEDGAGLLAYLLEPKAEERAQQNRRPEASGNPPARTAGRAGNRRSSRSEYGSDLVLLNLGDKSERVFPDVTEFSLSKDAGMLVYAVSSRKEEGNGVYRVMAGASDPPAALLAGRGKYSRLTWDEKQTRLAFLSDRDDAGAGQPKVKIYCADNRSPAAEEIVSATTAGFPEGFVVSERANLTFSQDGSKLFFGAAPPPEPENEEEEDGGEEKVIADLWHWKDDYIQPMQKVRAAQERNRSYLAVMDIPSRKLTQLADETMAEVSLSPDGKRAFGSDDRKYRIQVGYEAENYADYYLVSTEDGSRKAILAKQSGRPTWSPDGNFALFFDGRNWNTVSAADTKIVNLTKDLGVNFWQEDNDRPMPPSAYGSAGWMEGDKYVLLYDRYDIWRVAPDGSGAANLTGGVGRREKIQFRYAQVDPKEKAIDPRQPLLLRAEDEWTRDSGFYRVRIDGGAPERLLMAPKSFSSPTRAKNADVYLMTESTFNEFPDLLVSGPGLRDMKKVSDANPQKAQILWGTSELIRFTNTDGVPLSAMLIKPENFDPGRKYPLMVYIYERLSQGLHRFVDPRPGHSINISYYVSNGYLVLEPDIVYATGYPGQSALKCVLPAVQAVVDKGFVDENAIGIQGHSWGGYEIAYMVTQTNRFRAAAPGALVSNMTSAYSGIRWGSGMPRQFQYEHTQSRIGGSLWEFPMRYLENSPVFMADRIQTPILMLANDADDAVPWYQGIEFYLALRRLGKEVYMFNYNGEPHHLNRRVNQKDYTMRLQQFFDHFLKGAPMPDWMENGIPYLDREKEKERFNAVTNGKP